MTDPQQAALRRGARIVTGIAVVLLLPRMLLAWLVLPADAQAPDLAQVSFVLGTLLAGLLLQRALLRRVGSRWWTALIGFGALVVGGVATAGVTAVAPAAAVHGFSGSIAPPQVALLVWLFSAALAVWLLGAELIVASALGGLVAAAGGARRPRTAASAPPPAAGSGQRRR